MQDSLAACSSNEAPSARAVTGSHQKDNGVVGEDLGTLIKIMGAVETQSEAIRLIRRGSGSIMLFAYGFDRRDVAEELMEARDRGCRVRVAFDRRTTLSGVPRDMHQIAQELEARGVEVWLVNGVSVSAEYREVNRTVNGQGIQHAKTCLVDDHMIVGSCNWTTSSRSNFELNVLVKLREAHVHLVNAMMRERIEAGVLLWNDPGAQSRKPFEQDRRSASRSSDRYRRSYSLEPERR